jgi:hypothetical protein
MFLNPLMLAGLGGALVPLVLHLLSRARYRSVDWGAMMFLDGADPSDRRSSRLKQYVLLVAIVAVLAVALARPLAGGAWAGLAPGGATTVVLILDCSASMATIENGRWRMDAAREAAAAFLAQLREGDRAVLLTPGATIATGDTDETGIPPTTDLRTIAARVAAARPGPGRADFASALTRAAQILEQHARGQGKRVAIVCDRQAVGWRDVSPGFARRWQARFDPAERAGLLTILPVGTDAADNLAIESVRLVNPPAVRGERAEVEVRVRNHGPAAQPTITVALSDDRQDAGTQSMAVAARDVASVRFTTHFDTVGSHLLTATVPTGAGFPDDDTASTAVDVAPPIPVLFVSGDEPDPDAAAGADPAVPAAVVVPARLAESTFFRVAAAPYAAVGRRGIDPAVVKVLAAEQFDPASLVGQRVVVLGNVAQVSPPVAKALEQFVHEGGGLLIAPGAMTDVRQLNATLWRDGAGVMPAQLEPATAATGAAATTLLGLDFSHPALAFLRGRPDPIPVATVGRYFPATPRQPDAVVPATYASGRPFLVEARWGRGRVAVLTTPLDADWSTLPLSGFYVPFVQSLLRHLAAADTEDRNVAPGEPIVTTLDGDIADISLQRPSGARPKPAVRTAGGRTEVRYDDTAEPGVYVLRYRDRAAKQNRVLHFVVARDRDESDTTAITPQRWDELAATLGAARLDASDTADLAALATDRDGRELWAPLLALAAVLLAGELALGRLWSTAPVAPFAKGAG